MTKQHTFADKIVLSSRYTQVLLKGDLITNGFKYSKDDFGKRCFHKKIKDINVTVRIFLKYNTIQIAFCPGKILYNNNYHHLTYDEVKKSIKIVQNYFNEKIFTFDDWIHRIDFFAITELDVAFNATIGNASSHDCYLQWIDYIHRIDLSRCGIHMEYNTTEYTGNKSYMFRAYTKLDELKAHEANQKIDINECVQNLRIEISFKRLFLSGHRRSFARTLDEFDEIMDELLQVTNEKYKLLGLFDTIQSKVELLDKINNACKQKKFKERMIKFVELINTPALHDKTPNKAKERIDRKKYNANLQWLRNHGIFPYYSDALRGCCLQLYKNTKRKFDKKIKHNKSNNANRKNNATPIISNNLIKKKYLKINIIVLHPIVLHTKVLLI